MKQWLEDRLAGGGADNDACNFIADLVLPLHLQPMMLSGVSSHYAMLTTPLFLLAASLLIVSLLASHLLSKTPLHQLGQIGARGRKYFSWNENTTGDCGGRMSDWWIFGGSVWVRFFYGIGYLLFGCGCEKQPKGKGQLHSEDVGGENLFACFGVVQDASQKTTDEGNNYDDTTIKKGSRPKQSTGSLGIFGYDSSLGAHGPLVLAPLRASILLLAWCSICSFMVMTHTELIRWISNRQASLHHEVTDLLASHIARGIQYIVRGGGRVVSERYTSHPDVNIAISTIIYASFYVAFAELFLFVVGKVCMILHIYVPRGVSHPGGPRPHKIVRMPKWKEGRQHVLSKEALYVNNTKWRCAVAQDAHLDTDAKFGHAGSSRLTGEPFGRQIWTVVKTQLQPGQGSTEHDLENKLKKEYFGTKLQSGESTMSDDSGNIFSPIIDLLNSDKKGRQKKNNTQPDFLGSIVQNLLPGSNSKHQKDLARGDDNDLIQSLASGGRFPPLAFDPSKNPNSCDQLFRAQMISGYLERNGGNLPDELSFMEQNASKGVYRPKTAMEAAKRGVAFYSMIQTSDGHFAGDYGGPHFLLPGIIVAWYVMGRPSLMISPTDQVLMLHYLKVHQQADGGWGTHIESPSTMFGAVICYLAVRLLGVDKDEEWVKKGRDFIQKEGGAVMTSSWAKFWLCIVGCMDWKGHNSVPPEMWLLPNWFPFHPGRLWCHCRMVYLPMGYLYGSRFIYSHAETDPLIAELRNELYCQSYDSIRWDSTRHLVAEMDNYSPIPAFMKFAQNCLSLYENWFIFRPFRKAVRKAGLKFCSEYMQAEDLQTNYIDIGPVNKSLNMVAAYHAANNNINDEAVRKHMMRVPDYLWVAEDGMKMQGYNGSQCWDTSFAIQAVWECGLLDAFPVLSAKVWSYLERTQILSTETSQSSPAYLYESCDNRDKFYRHVSKGGWPFSTSAHGWPISDCTGEGLKGVLALMDSPTVMDAVKKGILKSIDPTRLHDAVNVILTLQNEDGGWATYENNRGFGWYEELNPSEVFGDIMIDYSYVECSMASLTALADFHEKFPHHRTNEITFAIRRGADFMKSIQRDDGSWYGSWACCFCYGCWFGIEGLIKAGESHTSPAILKCCKFLLSQQRSNGGWGEDFTSCYDKDYAQNGMQSYGDDGSGVVNTAWALMALSAAKCTDVVAVRRGVQYLMKRQLDCGDWPQEGISGVFNRACGITYTAYRNVFPIWALGRCVATYGSELDDNQ